MMAPPLLVLMLHLALFILALLTLARYISMAAVGFLLTVFLKGILV